MAHLIYLPFLLLASDSYEGMKLEQKHYFQLLLSGLQMHLLKLSLFVYEYSISVLAKAYLFRSIFLFLGKNPFLLKRVGVRVTLLLRLMILYYLILPRTRMFYKVVIQEHCYSSTP